MDTISFGQEYECKFHEDALAFFPEKLLTPCVDPDLLQSFDIKPQGTIFMGIDWAKKHDSTAVIVGEYRTDDKFLTIKRVESYHGMPYEIQLSHVFDICKELQVEKIFCDQTGPGEKLFEDLENRSGCMVEGITFTIPVKELLITNLRILFENERISIPKHADLISQLRSLERSYTEAGNVRFKHVGNAHDDLVWGLALCAHDCKTHDREAGFAMGKESIVHSLYTREENEEMAQFKLLF